MPLTSTRSKRAVAGALTTFLLVGGWLGVAAAPASATNFMAPFSTNATLLATGLYVNVVNGIITVSNPSGLPNFSSGQFGYTSGVAAPPAIIPTNPGLNFTPPPTFTSPSASAQKADEPAMELSAAAMALALKSSAAADLASKAEKARVAAAAKAEAAGAELEASPVWENDAAASAAVEAARIELQQVREQAGEGPNLDPDLAAAIEAATAALAAAELHAAQASADLVSAINRHAAVVAELAAAEQNAAATKAAAEEARAAADRAKLEAAIVVAASTPALPAALPAATEGGSSAQDDAPPLAPGEFLVLAAAGFQPETEVAFGIYSTPLSVAPVDVNADGIAAATFQIPTSFTGDHTLVAVGTGVDGLRRVLRIDVAVTAEEPTTPPATATPAPTAPEAATLAETGSNAALPIGGAAAIVLLGALLLGFRRRQAA